MNIKSLFLTASVAVVGLVFVACSHDDFIDKDAPVKNLKAEYAANFEKKFGKIDPNQTWDFCSMQPSYSLPSSSNGARTRAGEGEGSFACTTGELVVENDIISWMKTNMPAGSNNKKIGKPFKMIVPENDFTIVPIFQGIATYYWQLWMHVEGLGDQLVWSKGDNFKYRTSADGEWQSVGPHKDGVNKDITCDIQAPTYTYTDLPKDAEMYFYLKVWYNGSTDGYTIFERWQKNPNDQSVRMKECSSIDQMMISLNSAQIPVPAGIDQDNQVTIIGCEDGDDNDYEDLVFMVYGKPVPPTEYVKEVEEATTKRYFMEDLGTTDDFDFNDVVVDVKTNRKKFTYIYEEGTDELIDKKVTSLPDQAIVRAAGGTMDFTLTIGNTTWTKSQHMNPAEMWNTGWKGAAINWDAVLDKPFEVTGFKAADNNISVSVVGNEGDSGKVKEITFPKQGTAPMMLAVNPDVKWMKERVSIPTDWFTTEPAEVPVTE